ncbi:hypothetical protein KC345_g7521 [Hortaea werneckii]|nr:hypothetical protein KC345_g7521 [Hortaea werneckii]
MAATTSLVPTCASCVFGAVSTSVLSYTAHIIKTIEVDVTPHVFIYLNGTRETTSLESNTHTEAIAIPTEHTAESVDSSQTFSDIRNVTWTVGDATLTYPTSYIQYLAFAGAPAINTDEPACAVQTDATNVQLPSTTDAARFIFPLGNASSGIGLPGQLLEYVDSLSTVSDQFNGTPITACAPLLHSTYTPSPVYSTIQAEPTARTEADASFPSEETLLLRRYEGPRGKQQQDPIVTLSPDAKNNTQGIGRRQDLSGSGFATGTGTEGFAFPSAPEETASKVTTTLAYSSIEATNVHTTAFVIAPITGRDIVTSESPSPGPTTHGGNTNTATALPANNGGGDSKPNENGEQGSSSGNGDSSTGGQTNGGSSGGDNGSTSSGQMGGSGDGDSGQDSGQSQNGSHDGNADGGSDDASTVHSGSDGSGSSKHSDDDAGSHSGDHDATTGNGSDDGAGEQSGTSDTSSNSAGSSDGQSQSHGGPSSHIDDGDGGSEGSQDQSGSAAGSSVGNGDLSQTSGSNNGDNAGGEADISNLLGGIASAASNIDQAGGAANTAQVQAAQATFAANGNTYTAVKQGDAVVAEGASATFTVPRGSGTVFDGQTFSAASDGNAIAVNGQQQTLTVPGASPSYDQTTLTEADRTFTASQAEGTAIVFNGRI